MRRWMQCMTLKIAARAFLLVVPALALMAEPLTDRELSRSSLVALDDGWEFYWQQLLDPGVFEDITRDRSRTPVAVPVPVPVPDALVSIPASWTSYSLDGRSVPGHGYATFRKRVLLDTDQPVALRFWKIGTASTVWINGREVVRSGEVGRYAEDSIPGYQRTVVYVPGVERELDIVIHVSNFHHSRGGIRDSVEIGLLSQVRRRVYLSSIYEVGAVGVLLMIFIYHVFLFMADRSRKELFWFSLFCLVMFLRLLIDCSEILFILTSMLNWHLYVALDYLTLVWLPFLFFLFLRALYPHRFLPRERAVLLFDAAVFSILVVMSGSLIVTALNLFFMIHVVAVTSYILLKLGYCAYQREPYARFLGMAVLVLFVTAVHDMLFVLDLLSGPYLLHVGTTVFFFLQSVMLAGRVTDHMKRNETIQEEIIRTNQSYERFVPAEFISTLGREDILELSLGDHILDEITVLFVGIVSGRSRYDTLPDREKIRFLTTYIKTVDDCVREHGGFIDKCVGTDVMVLFTAGASGVYHACRDIHARLELFLRDSGLDLRLGHGIHTGMAALGIIGEAERLESTVISDSVNLASRIKGANRFLSTAMLISSSAYAVMADQISDQFRFLGKFFVKGKVESLPIFEVFLDDSPVTAAKVQTRDQFERALVAYSSDSLDEADHVFQEILQRNPEDNLVRYYRERIQFFRDNPAYSRDDLFELITVK